MDRTVEIYGRKINASKGFDLMKGKTLVEHFDTYEQASKAYKAQGCGYIRYYLAEGENVMVD